MARPKSRIPLNVFLNARHVGQLRRQSSGAIEFQYDPSWLAWENALPISLSLPLREDRYIGDPVFAVFDNLLPDSDRIRRRMAERVHAEGHDAYSLLAKIGRDCVGALQFLPETTAPSPAGTIDGSPASDASIAAKLSDLTASPLGMNEDEEFRISIAGAQEKTALLYWKGKWHIPHGTTPTTHILKPQIGMLPNGIDMSQSVENEYFCMKLTAAFGLPTANVEIADFKDKRALVVERFDRQWTSDNRLLRLPQEDMCQALSIHPNVKYESDGGPGISAILELLKGSDEPELDRRNFLKAQILFWLLGATDGHAKNFSVHLQPGGRFRLAPLYDVMSAQPALDAGTLKRNRMKLAMAVGDNRHYTVHGIFPRHFVQTAKKNGIPEQTVYEICSEILEMKEKALSRAESELPKSFPIPLAESVTKAFCTRLARLDGFKNEA